MAEDKKYLFEQIFYEKGKEFINSIDLPNAIANNIAPHFSLRPYQIDAFRRFICLHENDFDFKTNHLLFNMATGSGKTLIMAGLILYLYGKGYRNFLFFVNSNNLINKTKANLNNPLSSKYLFNKELTFDNKKIDITEVDNFEGCNKDNINICFTTIQQLHTDITVEKENSITIEDFKDKKIALIADECHHLNTKTRSKKQGTLIEKANWENTVENIFKQNRENLLLEFTATIAWDNKDIADKYYPKTLMRYDLKEFRADGYSKEISLLQADLDKKERMLQAIILSQYRQEVASKNKLFIKPVILFKSSKINDSLQNQEEFNRLIENLNPKEIDKLRENIYKSKNNSLLKRVFDYFRNRKITDEMLIAKLKTGFEANKCINVNEESLDKKSINKKDKQEVLYQQKILNELEDKNNQIRAVFAVNKLNEGWDVLNLFDIVRLYETRGTGWGKQGSDTIAEAQLIGRGARYCPFKTTPDQTADKRKFDENLTDDLRILEELHYHSMRDSKYITELRKELIKKGFMDDKHEDKELKLKEDFKQTAFYKKGLVFANKQEKTDVSLLNIFEESTYLKHNFEYALPTGYIKDGVLLVDNLREIEEESLQAQKNIKAKDFAIKDFAKNVKEQALKANTFYRYENLTKDSSKIKSLQDFTSKFLDKFIITVKGNTKQLEDFDNSLQYKTLLNFLQALEEEAKGQKTEFKGSEKFDPKPISEVFKDKILRLLKESERIDGDESFLANKDWYAYNANYGTNEEKSLCRLLDRMMAEFKKKFEEVYLLRNEQFFPIYDFKQGRPFYPDFVLFLRETKGDIKSYQIFIEPKGKHIELADKWKEDFLLAIREKYNSTITIKKTGDYEILGVPFYNQNDENSFRDELFASIN
jgi:type III restriction enzyme